MEKGHPFLVRQRQRPHEFRSLHGPRNGRGIRLLTGHVPQNYPQVLDFRFN